MNSIKSIVAIVIVICAHSLTSAAYRTPDGADNCVCSREYLPVCASDGFVYSNLCFFECQKVKDTYLQIVYDEDCYERSTPYEF